MKITLGMPLVALAMVCLLPALAHADSFSFTYTAYTYPGNDPATGSPNGVYSATGLLFGIPDASIAGAFDIKSGYITLTGVDSGLFSGTGMLYPNPSGNSFVNDPLVGGLGFDDVFYPRLYPQLNNGLLFVDTAGDEVLITNGLVGHEQSPISEASQSNPDYDFFLSRGPATPVVICSSATSTHCVQYNYDPLAIGVSSGEVDLAGLGYFSASPPPTLTPEPSSLALLGTGLIGILGIVRRRLSACSS